MSDSQELIHWQNHYGTKVDQVETFTIIDCETCGFRHITPIPTEEELTKIYQQEYYTSEKPLYIQQYEEDSDWWNIVYQERYDTFSSLMDIGTGSILDVGSGPGLFLQYGKKLGWKTKGIEPSDVAVQYSRKLDLDISQCMLDTNTEGEFNTYDVIHMSSVLEHVPAPSTLLEICYRLLNNTGILCVTVPNDYNPFQDILRNSCEIKPWWIVPPHHINYFNFDSLQKLLEKVGFIPELVEGTFPIDLFLLMGDIYIGDDHLGRTCHKKRMTFEKNLFKADRFDLKREIYKNLAKSGLGREVVIYAKKQ